MASSSWKGVVSHLSKAKAKIGVSKKTKKKHAPKSKSKPADVQADFVPGCKCVVYINRYWGNPAVYDGEILGLVDKPGGRRSPQYMVRVRYPLGVGLFEPYAQVVPFTEMESLAAVANEPPPKPKPPRLEDIEAARKEQEK